jgi:hypothetical protein
MTTTYRRSQPFGLTSLLTSMDRSRREAVFPRCHHSRIHLATVSTGKAARGQSGKSWNRGSEKASVRPEGRRKREAAGIDVRLTV